MADFDPKSPNALAKALMQPNTGGAQFNAGDALNPMAQPNLAPAAPIQMYHGSPTSGIENFAGNYTYLTPKPEIARFYSDTKNPLMGAQRDLGLGGTKSPTVYNVDVNGAKIFDMRNPEHQALYNQIRAQHNSSVTDTDNLLPKLQSEGFIHSHSGLPQWGHATQIMDLLEPHGFDAMHVQEAAAHGPSLLVRNSSGKAKIVGSK